MCAGKAWSHFKTMRWDFSRTFPYFRDEISKNIGMWWNLDQFVSVYWFPIDSRRRCLAAVDRKDFIPTLQQAFYKRSITADDAVQFDIDRELIVRTLTHRLLRHGTFVLPNPFSCEMNKIFLNQNSHVDKKKKNNKTPAGPLACWRTPTGLGFFSCVVELVCDVPGACVCVPCIAGFHRVCTHLHSEWLGTLVLYVHVPSPIRSDQVHMFLMYYLCSLKEQSESSLRVHINLLMQ